MKLIVLRHRIACGCPHDLVSWCIARSTRPRALFEGRVLRFSKRRLSTGHAASGDTAVKAAQKMLGAAGRRLGLCACAARASHEHQADKGYPVENSQWRM